MIPLRWSGYRWCFGGPVPVLVMVYVADLAPGITRVISVGATTN